MPNKTIRGLSVFLHATESSAPSCLACRDPACIKGCWNWCIFLPVCIFKKPHMLSKHPTSYSYRLYSWVSSLPGSQKSMECPSAHCLTSWPWPLTYDLDLSNWPRYPSTWPPCQNSSLYVCPFGCYSETDTHTHIQRDRHTHTRRQNYYTHHVRDEKF